MENTVGARDPAVLIAAAGRSTRMGGTDKLLRQIDGVPQLRRIVLAAIATGCPVLVTLPPEADARRAALAGLNVALQTVPECDEGIAASLRAGAAMAEMRPLMVVLADLPDLTAEDLARMIRAHRQTPDALLRAASSDHAGHPVLFPADLVAELGVLSGDTGAHCMISRHAARLRLVPLPGQNALRDLDTPQDWTSWEAERASAPDNFFPGTPLVPDPVSDILAQNGPALIAVIVGIEGTSYRNVGTLMAIFPDGSFSGSLTNGCIEADLACHAQEVFATGTPKLLRYGDGSPFFDIRLPCGGGLDIGLFPVTDVQVLADAAHVLASRNAISIGLGMDGSNCLLPARTPGWSGEVFVFGLTPVTRAIVFGDGPEAETLTQLLYATGLQTRLVTSSPQTPASLPPLTCRRPPTFAEIQLAQRLADPWTAVVTLYHDHDKEADILAEMLRGPAFYIGAQGSRRVAERRLAQLKEIGLEEPALAKLHAPAGLIPSTRDPQSLAVSILSEIFATHSRLSRP